uniref:PDZ domain-containing protein n=1 Tax=Gasterosteus aculeatus aculeatus TaxID=481459 RepID=A0AAQ4RH78_GASAC
MGGRGMGRRLSTGDMMRGVFVKHISADSPAARNGTLRTGDRILEVCGVDLRDASHEQAVEAIRRAGDCVSFLVQSGQHRSQSPLLNRERATAAPQSNSHGGKEAETPSLFLTLSPTNPYTPTPFKVPSPICDRPGRRRRSLATAAPPAGSDADRASDGCCSRALLLSQSPSHPRHPRHPDTLTHKRTASRS